MNLARLDLNLLLALDALLVHRNVTRAADQLGLTQPALSASLARLRRHFDDPLLVRVGNTYRLTPLASVLEERTRVALSSFDRVFRVEPDFEPATTTREFSLLVTDYALLVLGRHLAAIVADEAPLARLRFAANTPSSVVHAERTLLAHDLMLIPHGDLLDLPHQFLFQDEWVLIMSADNPRADQQLTIDELQQLPWVVPFYSPVSATPAARQLRILGLEPTVKVVTESFLAVPLLVAGTDRVALVQRALIDSPVAGTGVRVVPCPVEISPLVQTMWWHPVNSDDTEHRYLRSVVERAAAAAVADRSVR